MADDNVASDGMKEKTEQECEEVDGKTENGDKAKENGKDNGVKNGKSTNNGDESKDSTNGTKKSNDDAKKVEKKTVTELSKYWKAVTENPGDFTGWTYLLQYVEQQKNVVDAQEAFDAFLEKYPYCFGYWRKFAEMERKYGTLVKAEEIYDRGVEAIPLSIDLWMHFINFYATAHDGEDDVNEKRRALFEKAIAAAGTDFRSDKIWDAYITFEESIKEYVRVTAVYDRLLYIPTQLYSHHMDKFKKHVETHHPRDILSLDEFFKLRREVFAAKTAHMDTSVGDEAGDGPPGDDAPPGEEAPPGSEGDGQAVSQVFDESEVPELRAKIISQREDVYANNEMEVSRRWAFEEAIKRPYFHVKPLERSQLKNWREYLDYEMDNGSHERIVVLYERCIVACALYDEFWLKYAHYMESHSVDGVRSVFKRACCIHLPKKSSLFFAWASFEERNGETDEALEVLGKFEKSVPNHAVVTLRKIGVLRRRGDHEKVADTYKQCIAGTESVDTKNFYAIKYARYLAKVLGDVERSREVLKEAIDKDKTNSKLYLQLIDTEYQTCPVATDRIDDVFTTALSSELPINAKLQFSQRRLDFLEDFGVNIDKISAAYDDHQRLIKDLGNDKKRKHSEISADDIELWLIYTRIWCRYYGHHLHLQIRNDISDFYMILDAAQFFVKHQQFEQLYTEFIYPYIFVTILCLCSTTNKNSLLRATKTSQPTDKKPKSETSDPPDSAALTYPSSATPATQPPQYTNSYGTQIGYNAAYYQQWANYAQQAAQQGYYPQYRQY